MALHQLSIDHVRNLQRVRLDGLQQHNVFFGLNGSGKTSVLEAVHLLGMARSFRGTGVKPVITHGQERCVVFGVASLPAPAQSRVHLGVARSASGDTEIRIGGEPVRSLAPLAEHLPLLIVSADTFSLLTGAPADRRRFLDWGVFHVEHGFFRQWQRFRRSIKQRNNLLRRGNIDDLELSVWTKDLAASGAAVSALRKAYFDKLAPRFVSLMGQLAPSLKGIELQFRQGWDAQLEYAEALAQGVTADREQGYTHVGPQRADVRVLSEGHLAADTLSRGQQKLVVCGMKLAQGRLLAELRGLSCTYLIDDLPSELDNEHSRRVCELLAGMEAQVFITCVAREEIQSVWPEPAGLAMFHVEQGQVTPVTPGEAATGDGKQSTD
ncbi:MAG: DNA replication/repair protein RecF [Pseudomonadota bacterium]